MAWTFKNTVVLIMDIAVVVISAIIFVFYYYGRSLPNERTLLNYNPPIATKIYSADGTLIDEYAAVHRSFIKIEDIPEIVKQAFIIAEDKDFYNHAGISIASVLRAIMENTAKKLWRSKPSSGSTITQQVAKNLLVGNEKSISRKIKEAIMSFRIEATISKNKILEIYLNHIYLGKGCYGVKEACLYYFDKDIEKILPEEAAFIASLSSAPSIYSSSHEKLILKRNAILVQMYEKRLITKDEMLLAISKPIKIKMQRTKRLVPFVSDSVYRYMCRFVSHNDFFNGGFSITTTIDLNLQKIAAKCLENGLIDHEKSQEWQSIYRNTDLRTVANALPKTINKIFPVIVQKVYEKYCIGVDEENKQYTISTKHLNISKAGNNIRKNDIILCRKTHGKYEAFQQPKVTGGIVVIDAKNSEILAMLGGYSYDTSSFNCVTQANRQPGSSIKPFIYAAAFDYGFKESDYVEDKKITFRLSNGILYTPKNYNGTTMGKISIRNALIYSQNLATINLAQKIGITNVYDYLQKFGIIDRNFSISYLLGACETSLINLMAAFSAFTNDGKMIIPSIINNVLQHDKSVLPQIYNKHEIQVIKSESARKIKQILHEATVYGTASGLAKIQKKYNVVIGGKTGTSNDCKDAWFIGYMEYKGKTLLIGVFVGYPYPKSLGKKATGSRIALPIFKEFVKKYIKYVG